MSEFEFESQIMYRINWTLSETDFIFGTINKESLIHVVHWCLLWFVQSLCTDYWSITSYGTISEKIWWLSHEKWMYIFEIKIIDT